MEDLTTQQEQPCDSQVPVLYSREHPTHCSPAAAALIFVLRAVHARLVAVGIWGKHGTTVTGIRYRNLYFLFSVKSRSA